MPFYAGGVHKQAVSLKLHGKNTALALLDKPGEVFFILYGLTELGSRKGGQLSFSFLYRTMAMIMEQPDRISPTDEP